jgi:DNA-binding LytR/AlgR family response regulator
MNNQNTPEAINAQIISSIESIVYLQGDINYTNLIYLNGKKKTMPRTLKRFEESSEFKSWFRIHRAYLVNPKFVTTVCLIDSTLELKSGLKLPISRRRLLNFKEIGRG